MAEVVNAIVAFAVIIFIFRWVTSPSTFVFVQCSTKYKSVRVLRSDLACFKLMIMTPLGGTGAESSGDVAAARALKFKPKKVTDEMVHLSFCSYNRANMTD